jgi:MFS family permease
MAAVGIGLGPFFGGLLLKWFDWNAVFLLNVPVCAVAFARALVLVPESRDPEPGAFDLPGAGLSIATLGSLVYSLIEAPDRGWTDPIILGGFAAAAVLGVAFVRWELRTAEPMLNLSYFRNPRFSVASGGIGVASFALFGAIFGTTQYLQDAHGYSALQAGAAMVPLAFGMVMGAKSSTKAVPRIGAGRVVTAGLLGMGTVLTTALLWTPDLQYWPIGLWFFGLALSMGWILAPATGSVMSAVPPEKSGVASAMNDVTRQVGGALGTAVVGSIISTIYSSRIGDDVSTLPEASRTAAEGSIGQANAVASTLPSSDGAHLMDAAANAFTDALGIGLGIGACAALLAAIAVRRWLPGRDDADAIPTGTDLRELDDLPDAA